MRLSKRGVVAAMAAVLWAGPSGAADKAIIVQSTTSTANSGLYDYMLPIFEKKTGIRVHVVAVGTGQAIRNATRGDGDVLFVHARAAEEKFVRDGWGVSRADVMYNDFIVVGPPADPAKVAGLDDAKKALTMIAKAKAMFASRGDNSGTNKAELALWQKANVDPKKASGTWYRETGSGMGATLNAAIGMGAYVLTDRATWISFGNRQGFDILVQDDPLLFNQYGVIMVNPERHPHVKVAEVRRFMNWILGPDGQQAIAGFRSNDLQLFFPNAAPP